MIRILPFLFIVLIAFIPRESAAQEKLSVCDILKQGNIETFQDEFLISIKSYAVNRDELSNMLTKEELASFENVQRNVKEYPDYKEKMEQDKIKINNLFIKIEKCVGQNLEHAEEFPEVTIAKYLTLKERLTDFFKFDHYFMKGFDKMIHFMLERRGAYFVKEDVISFIRLNDWEYYRNSKHKMKQIITTQNSILNSLSHNL